MDISVMWFRRDLRLIDNEAVSKAHQHSMNRIYVFVIDPWFFEQPEIGWLRVKFLCESLSALDSSLAKYGSNLTILSGKSTELIPDLLKLLKDNDFNPTLFFNDDIQVEYGRTRDESIVSFCKAHTISAVRTNNYFLLHDELLMKDWWKHYYDYQYSQQHTLSPVLKQNRDVTALLSKLPQINPRSIASDLKLTLPSPKQTLFTGGEDSARTAVYTFLKDRVDGYRWKLSRPYLAQQGATSLLGPHLAFGTISNRAVFQASVTHRDKLENVQPKKAFDIATYLDRLRWRDSFTQRLWFHPELMWENRFREFNSIYNQNPLTPLQQSYFDKWKQAKTGFPLLDAAMTQLKQDGFINFRMRAMAATFLTINCGVSWHYGAQYFMNCLVDGDIAINHWQWQMQAGITNPLSPTFRMYSPNKNFRDRDSSADYVHFWLPETRGKNVETILQESKPMLDFNQTRKTNGKIISDIRKQVRDRIIAEKGSELQNASSAHRTVINYGKYSSDRYKRYFKS